MTVVMMSVSAESDAARTAAANVASEPVIEASWPVQLVLAEVTCRERPKLGAKLDRHHELIPGSTRMPGLLVHTFTTKDSDWSLS